jgi:hypothetical protein
MDAFQQNVNEGCFHAGIWVVVVVMLAVGYMTGC